MSRDQNGPLVPALRSITVSATSAPVTRRMCRLAVNALHDWDTGLVTANRTMTARSVVAIRTTIYHVYRKMVRPEAIAEAMDTPILPNHAALTARGWAFDGEHVESEYLTDDSRGGIEVASGLLAQRVVQLTWPPAEDQDRLGPLAIEMIDVAEAAAREINTQLIASN